MQDRPDGPLPHVGGEGVVRLVEPTGSKELAHVAHLAGPQRGGEPLAMPRWFP
jgi:hypothetical protein